MTTTIDLMQDICKNAEMGRDSLSHLLTKIDDSELQRTLKAQMEEYDRIYRKADELLRAEGGKPEQAGMMAKTMAHVMTDVKTMVDDSAGNISEMVIEGCNMGITKMTKHLNEYDGQNREAVALANRHIANLQQNIDALHAFL